MQSKPEHSDNPPLARVIAFYLPQFHPIPENDAWWGPGFTEWTNVAKARPLFRGHRQPRLPADLGFYDLRLPEVREQQADLARSAGVAGFCYWHYWFGNGRRILERPFQDVLRSGKPDFPFCLAWANQTWSGIWHGNPGRILIEQSYPGRADEAAHFEVVLPAFLDSRYLTVDGRPIFVLLDPDHHPDPGAFARHWRELADKAGLPGLYLVAMSNKGPNPRLDAFDAITAYGPGEFLDRLPQGRFPRRLRQLRRLDLGKYGTRLTERFMQPQRYGYRKVVRKALSAFDRSDRRLLPTVIPDWDNTPRSGRRGVVFEGSTPGAFEDYLERAVDLLDGRPDEERIVFLKAWNEWAEGNYVEPDRAHGSGYLQAIRSAVVRPVPAARGTKS